MRKLTKSEIKEYIKAVANEIFNKDYANLTMKQKGVIRISIISRRETEELDSKISKQLDEYILGELI